MSDIKDILGVAKTTTPTKLEDIVPSAKKKDKPTEEQPKGRRKRIGGLTLEDISIVPSTTPSLPSPQFKDKRKLGKRKADAWEWRGFRSSARKDNAVLFHWVKKDEHTEDYVYARFNKKVGIFDYTDEQYNKYFNTDPLWTREETDELWQLIKRFDLRFIVIADRFRDRYQLARERREREEEKKRREATTDVGTSTPTPTATPTTTITTTTTEDTDKAEQTNGVAQQQLPQPTATTTSESTASTLVSATATGPTADLLSPPRGYRPKTIEDLKERYYAISRKLVELSAGPDEDVSRHPLVKFHYNRHHEEERKLQAERLYGRTRTQIEEEQRLMQEYKRIETNLKKHHKKVQLTKIETKKKKKSQAVLDQEDYYDEEPDYMETSQGAEASFIQPIKGARKEKSQGVYARSHVVLTPMSVSNKIAKRVDDLLIELGIGTRPLPTAAVTKMFNEIRQDIAALIELQKRTAGKEYEVQLLRDQKAAAVGGMSAVLSPDIGSRKRVGDEPVADDVKKSKIFE